MSCGLGVGLVLVWVWWCRHRLDGWEFNFVKALRKAQTDRTKQLQVGLGLQFL